MARQSQGVRIRRESSVAGSTANESTNTISFDNVSKEFRRQAGFSAFSTGMRVECNASLNNGVFTIKTTAATAMAMYDIVSAQASGVTITLVGHAMQNIGQVVSFNGPSLSASPIDITNLQSTAKEKMIGVYDGGQISMSLILDYEASNVNLHDALVRDMKDRTKRKFDVIFTDPATHKGAVYFGGYISAFSITGSVDNALKADITIALSSGVNFINPVGS